MTIVPSPQQLSTLSFTLTFPKNGLQHIDLDRAVLHAIGRDNHRGGGIQAVHQAIYHRVPADIGALLTPQPLVQAHKHRLRGDDGRKTMRLEEEEEVVVLVVGFDDEVQSLLSVLSSSCGG